MTVNVPFLASEPPLQASVREGRGGMGGGGDGWDFGSDWETPGVWGEGGRREGEGMTWQQRREERRQRQQADRKKRAAERDTQPRGLGAIKKD